MRCECGELLEVEHEFTTVNQELFDSRLHLGKHPYSSGVWRFKEGLGAQFTPHIGAYDYAQSRLFYWLYSVALPRYLDWLRRRHQGAASHPLQHSLPLNAHCRLASTKA